MSEAKKRPPRAKIEPQAADIVLERRFLQLHEEAIAEAECEAERRQAEAEAKDVVLPPPPSQPKVVDRAHRTYGRYGNLLSFLDSHYMANFKTLRRLMLGCQCVHATFELFIGVASSLTEQIERHTGAVLKALHSLTPGQYNGSIGMELLATLCLVTRHGEKDPSRAMRLVQRVADFAEKSPNVQLFDAKGLLSVDKSARPRVLGIKPEDARVDVAQDTETVAAYARDRRLYRLLDPAQTAAATSEIRKDAQDVRVGNSPWHMMIDAIRESWNQRLQRIMPWEQALRIYIFRLHMTADEWKRLAPSPEKKDPLPPRNSDWQDALDAICKLSDILTARIDPSRNADGDGDMEELAKCALDVVDMCTVYGSFPWRARFAPRLHSVGSIAGYFGDYLVDVVRGEASFHTETMLRSAICVLLYGFVEFDPMHYDDVDIPPPTEDSKEKDADWYKPVVHRVFERVGTRSYRMSETMSGFLELFMFLCGDTTRIIDPEVKQRLREKRKPADAPDTLVVSALRMRLAALMLPLTRDPARPMGDVVKWTQWPLNGLVVPVAAVPIAPAPSPASLMDTKEDVKIVAE